MILDYRERELSLAFDFDVFAGDLAAPFFIYLTGCSELTDSDKPVRIEEKNKPFLGEKMDASIFDALFQLRPTGGAWGEIYAGAAETPGMWTNGFGALVRQPKGTPEMWRAACSVEVYLKHYPGHNTLLPLLKRASTFCAAYLAIRQKEITLERCRLVTLEHSTYSQGLPLNVDDYDFEKWVLHNKPEPIG